jgi:segregation and condensation protein B
MTVEHKIEAILFALGEPVTLKELANLVHEDEMAVSKGLEALHQTLLGRGIVLVESHQGFALGTNPEATELLDAIRKDELGKELSKSSLETLAIILYYDGATRSDIDFIRGVNSNFILRNLVMRGLIERREHNDDSRKAFYVPTIDLLTHLGIAQASDLPEYQEVHKMFMNRQAIITPTIVTEEIILDETSEAETTE